MGSKLMDLRIAHAFASSARERTEFQLDSAWLIMRSYLTAEEKSVHLGEDLLAFLSHHKKFLIFFLHDGQMCLVPISSSSLVLTEFAQSGEIQAIPPKPYHFENSNVQQQIASSTADLK